MSHPTTSGCQLRLTPIDAYGNPSGPGALFPADWPSAVPVIDLTAATVHQAAARFAEWIGSDRAVLTAVTPGCHPDEVHVTVEHRTFRASLTAPEPPVVLERPERRCWCGDRAVVVIETADFGHVGWCGRHAAPTAQSVAAGGAL